MTTADKLRAAKWTPTPWKLGRTLDKHPCIISTVTETCVREEDEANAWRKIACVNAFHSPTRTIATEDIQEGDFWRLYDALIDLSDDLNLVTPFGRKIDALLQRFKVEETKT